MTSKNGDGKCAMRGSCGKKGFFGKPLPCPYDGPPVKVQLLPLLTEQCPYFSNSPMTMILAVYSVKYVVQNLKRVQSVARQTN